MTEKLIKELIGMWCTTTGISNLTFAIPIDETHKSIRVTIEEETERPKMESSANDNDTIRRGDARLCLTGDITGMSIVEYISMVDKKLKKLPPTKKGESQISSQQEE